VVVVVSAGVVLVVVVSVSVGVTVTVEVTVAVSVTGGASVAVAVWVTVAVSVTVAVTVASVVSSGLSVEVVGAAGDEVTGSVVSASSGGDETSEVVGRPVNVGKVVGMDTVRVPDGVGSVIGPSLQATIRLAPRRTPRAVAPTRRAFRAVIAGPLPTRRRALADALRERCLSVGKAGVLRYHVQWQRADDHEREPTARPRLGVVSRLGRCAPSHLNHRPLAG
jgi:hypothetical protein